MARFLYRFQLEYIRRKFCSRLAFFFLAGLASGVYLYTHSNPLILPLMDRAADASVSIVGLASAVILPFLLSAFLVNLGWKQFLPLVAFGKAFCFAFVATGILSCHGAGGWIALPLLMFSDILSIPVLWLYWLQQRDRVRLSNFTMEYLVFFLLVGSVDYLIISPFWASL
jgi:hypothetical protein